jgi:ABC-type multidrug transport system permease subunit
MAGWGVRNELRAAYASWWAMTSERLYMLGASGGFLTMLVLPLFQVGTLYLIYGGAQSELFQYALVAQAANAFVLNTIFWVGEILDRERVRGTLIGLFLAPCTRFSWLSGFILAGLIETVLMASSVLLFGRFALGVHFNPNLPVVALTLMLFLLSLWGMGIVFSGFGLLIKKANPLANLFFSFALLLGGAYFPVSEMPEPLHTVARLLPLGYGMQALADAALLDASLRDVLPDLLPLAGFAVILPLVGMLAFTWLERKVRVRGELDLY